MGVSTAAGPGASGDFGRLFDRGSVAGMSDRALLDRFVFDRDEAAFEAIVRRHGPLVLGVCRRFAGDPEEADDAFQATFLLLARRAAGLRDADRLSAWLYGCASRIARRQAGRRRRRSSRFGPPAIEPESVGGGEADGFELRAVIDAEIARLSERHREVVVICLLEGRSPEEAAARLRCSTGTVKSRLARARDTLRSRLTARGLAPASVVGVFALLGTPSRAEGLPDRLVDAALTAVRGSLDPIRLSNLTQLATLGGTTVMTKSLRIAAAAAVVGVSALGGFAALQSQAQDAPGAGGRPRGGAGPAVQAAPDRETIGNLRVILLAFHNYMSANNELPSPFIRGEDGLPKLSWRVAILPYIGEEALYRKFRLDEPWDGPTNKELVAQMPKAFGAPDAPTRDGLTRIRAFTATGFALDPLKSVRFQDVLDGTSNTVAIGVAAEAVPWTKPEGLTRAVGANAAGLRKAEDGSVLVAMLDGSVRRIRGEFAANPILMNALLTRAGGEVIDGAVFGAAPTDPQPAGGGGVPAPAPTDAPAPHGDPVLRAGSVGLPGEGLGPAPGGAPKTITLGRGSGGAPADLEARLREIDRKLDRILERLGERGPAGAGNPGVSGGAGGGGPGIPGAGASDGLRL